MLKNDLYKLEYNKIIEKLTIYCKTCFGKNIAQKLVPSSNKLHVESTLQETFEAINFFFRKGSAPISETDDISEWIKRLAGYSSISASGLLDVAKILRMSRELKEYFYENSDFDLSEFSHLENYFSALYSNIGIEKSIFDAIIDAETIADNASAKLGTLRRSRRKLEDGIKDALNKVLHSNLKYIMEPIITIRNERYVIPVKEAYKNEIKGFIHDVSASGSTVFIEPVSVFDINNKISNLKIEENIEIEKILEKLSTSLFPYITELENDLSLIGSLDFIFAKASYSKDIGGVIPKINDEKYINLICARHPLIAKDVVVPIDISIGKGYTSLIITGPNTGGKTVTLKTVGLLTLMACSGMAIPAKENSSIYVFDNVFADIGDEQSISESLSTFSSHIVNIIEIIKNSTSESLILVDELGSGTDPLEGSSLAVSILEHFHNIGSISLCTTHYEEVKEFALVTDGFENASSEFDIENLRPTYKILIGIPGKSNAFAISKRLGLDDKILSRAQEFINSDSIHFEDLLKNIYDDKLQIEKEKEEIEKNLNQATLLRKSLEQDNLRKDIDEKERIEKAKIEARNILLNAKDEANEIIKKLNETTDTRTANKLRENLNSSLKGLYITNSDNLNDASSLNTDKKKIEKASLHVGDMLKLSTFSEIATITSLSGKPNVIQVKVGNAKMSIKLENVVEVIQKVGNNSFLNNSKKLNNFSSSVSINKAKIATPEINVIGQNVDEACFVIDKYLDDCYIAKLETVRIVHGKGTGKLREGIHIFLRKHPHVKSFRLGTFGEGEMGVTVVTLK